MNKPMMKLIALLPISLPVDQSSKGPSCKQSYDQGGLN
jgi:hypothetical protein